MLILFYSFFIFQIFINNSQNFFKNINVSVISCGESNSYNHPTEEALNNLQEYSYIFATEDCNPEVTNKFSDYSIINGDILVRVPQDALNYYVSDIKQTKINKFKIKN